MSPYMSLHIQINVSFSRVTLTNGIASPVLIAKQPTNLHSYHTYVIPICTGTTHVVHKTYVLHICNTNSNSYQHLILSHFLIFASLMDVSGISLFYLAFPLLVKLGIFPQAFLITCLFISYAHFSTGF